jgi:hypothetical protein
MAAPVPEQPAAAPTRRNGWFSWLMLFLLATAAISLLAVYLPSRVKMLGLYAIGLGLLAGWLAARLAETFHVTRTKSAVTCAIVFVVIAAGQMGMAVESYRVYRTAEERALAANPKRAAALQMLQSLNLPDDAKSEQAVADVRKTIGTNGTTFVDFLQYRVSQIGIQSRRVATVFWVVELVLGGAAGTWIFRRLTLSLRLEASDPPAKLDE